MTVPPATTGTVVTGRSATAVKGFQAKLTFNGSVPRPMDAIKSYNDWANPLRKLLARVRLRVNKAYLQHHKDAPVHYVQLYKDGGNMFISDPLWAELDVLGDGRQPGPKCSISEEDLFFDNWQAYWVIGV
jgi:hypothetical protein